MTFNLSQSELRALSRAVYDDYQNDRGPFSEYDLPEYEVLTNVPPGQERANFITLVASINLNAETAGSKGIWQSALDAYESDTHRWLFDTQNVAEKSSLDVYTEAFKPLGWSKSGQGDKKAHVFWTENATTIAEHFDGDSRNLIADCGHDAERLLDFLQEDHPDWYPSLKGKKVSALWLRLIDEEIHQLDSLEAVPIPVDRNILTVTEFLTVGHSTERNPENMGNVRNLWHSVCDGMDLVPVRLDKPLWLCGKQSRLEAFDYWHNWGRDYLEQKVEAQLA